MCFSNVSYVKIAGMPYGPFSQIRTQMNPVIEDRYTRDYNSFVKFHGKNNLGVTT